MSKVVESQIAAAQAEQEKTEQSALAEFPEFREWYSRSGKVNRRRLMEELLQDKELRRYRTIAVTIEEMRKQSQQA